MSDEGAINVLFLGPVYGWLCTVCGQSRLGHPTEKEAKRSAEEHAISKHAPSFPEGKTSMTMYVKWDDDDA